VIRRIEILTPQAVRALALPLSLLHRACFAEDPWDARAIAEIAGLAGFFGLVAREDAGGEDAAREVAEDADPVGFAFAFGVGEECEIAALGVTPERRRAGIGAALLDAVCREARRRGAGRLVLEVAADNTAARSLYAAHGFVRAGWRRDYYRRAERSVDAQVLRLTLAPPPPSI
jgi:[ribosomal protein S18]-alanine N-acetyltransferase